MNHKNQTRKILVVDDDPVIRDMMADILEFEGYSISIARNGSEALQLLRSGEEYLVFLRYHDACHEWQGTMRPD